MGETVLQDDSRQVVRRCHGKEEFLATNKQLVVRPLTIARLK